MDNLSNSTVFREGDINMNKKELDELKFAAENSMLFVSKEIRSAIVKLVDEVTAIRQENALWKFHFERVRKVMSDLDEHIDFSVPMEFCPNCIEDPSGINDAMEAAYQLLTEYDWMKEAEEERPCKKL